MIFDETTLERVAGRTSKTRGDILRKLNSGDRVPLDELVPLVGHLSKVENGTLAVRRRILNIQLTRLRQELGDGYAIECMTTWRLVRK